jgi:hypothetical protein
VAAPLAAKAAWATLGECVVGGGHHGIDARPPRSQSRCPYPDDLSTTSCAASKSGSRAESICLADCRLWRSPLHRMSRDRRCAANLPRANLGCKRSENISEDHNMHVTCEQNVRLRGLEPLASLHAVQVRRLSDQARYGFYLRLPCLEGSRGVLGRAGTADLLAGAPPHQSGLIDATAGTATGVQDDQDDHNGDHDQKHCHDHPSTAAPGSKSRPPSTGCSHVSHHPYVLPGCEPQAVDCPITRRPNRCPTGRPGPRIRQLAAITGRARSRCSPAPPAGRTASSEAPNAELGDTAH